MENITDDIPPKLTSHNQASIGKTSIFKRKDPVPSCTLTSYKSTDNIAEDIQLPLIANTQPSQGAKRKYSSIKKEYEENKRDRGFCPHWLRTYTWLSYDKTENIMWCSVCREFKNLKNACVTNLVTGTQNWRTDILAKHQRSKNHIAAMSAKLAKEQKPIATMSRQLNLKHHEKLSFLFNTAYAVAKQNWSLRDFVALCELQVKNGVNLGDNYLTHQAARDFIDSIAYEQRQDTTRDICNSRFFSIKADGSTDRSVYEQESVYIHYLKDGESVSKFVALEAVDNADAAGVLAAIDQALSSRLGISLEDQKKKMVNVNLDGAAVNMGVHNGVAIKLQQRHGSHLIATHCVNHDLELSILDMRKDDEYFIKFDKTLKVMVT